MIYLFDKDEQLIKIVRKTAVKTALQTYSLTTENYVSDRLTVEMKALNDDELERVEYMAIQAVDDTHNYHFFYVAQKHSEGKITELIGVQSGIEELRKTVVYDKRPKNAFAREVITELLAGTNWSARFVGESLPRSTTFYYVSTFDALKKVCEVWDLEMQFFVQMNSNKIGARYVDFKQKIGAAVGKRVVYGHNALQILQEVERTNIYTALVGRGKGEEVSSAEENASGQAGYGRKINFEDVVWSTAQGNPVNKPKGQKYVEIPEMTARYGIRNADGTMRAKIGFVDFSEEEDKANLLQRTYTALIDASRPQVTFKTSSVYLKGVAIGDTIRVVRHDKRIDYETRVFEITLNRLNNQSSDIKLGDRIGVSQTDKAQAIADKAVEDFVTNEFAEFVQKLPDYLPSADGFNTNWYGADDPTTQYPGKVLINDIWFKPDPEHEGHYIMFRWTGEAWEELVRTYSAQSIEEKLEAELKKIDEEFASNKASVQDGIAKAKSDAQAYADELAAEVNEKIAEQASQAEEIRQGVADAETKAKAYADTVAKTVSDKLAEAKAVLEASDQEQNRKVQEALDKAGANRDLAQTAKAIGEQAKSDAANALARALTLKAEAIAEATRLDTVLRQETENKLATAKSQAVAEANRLLETAKADLNGKIVSAQTEITKTNDSIKVLAKKSELDTLASRLTTAEAKTETVAGRITTEIAETKALIPTKTSSVNLVKNSKINESRNIYGFGGRTVNLEAGKTYWFGARAKKTGGTADKEVRIYLYKPPWTEPKYISFTSVDYETKFIKVTPKTSGEYNINSYWYPNGGDRTGTADVDWYMVVESDTQPTNWSPNPEDTVAEIESVKTTITQTAEGQKQLSTKLTETAGKVTTAETKINQLIGDVSSKVSQTEYNHLKNTVDSQQTAINQTSSAIALKADKTYVDSVKNTTATKAELKVVSDGISQLATKTDLNAATGRLTTAETSIRTLAGQVDQRLTATQVDSAITAKGYQTKAQVDSNITGRGYITSSALTPYVQTTVFDNYKRETAQSIERGLTETKALIPTKTSSVNLVKNSKINESSNAYGFGQRTVNLIAGKTYWFVARAKKTGGTADKKVQIYLLKSNWSESTRLEFSETEYTTKSVKFVPKTTDTFIIRSYWYPNGGDRTGTADVDWYMVVESDTQPTNWSPNPEDAVSTVEFNTVKETAQLYERVLGKTEGDITTNVAQKVMTSSAFVSQVTNKLTDTSSKVTQLSNSYAITLLGSKENVLTQLNLNTNGVRIAGKLIHLDGTVTANDAFFKTVMANKIEAGNIKAGAITAEKVAANAITADKILVNQALIDKLVTNSLWADRLFAQTAFINKLKTVSIEAGQIRAGLITSNMIATSAITADKLQVNDALLTKLTADDALLNKLTVKQAFIAKVKAIDLSAERVTTGTLNAANVNIINLNANKIVGLDASFIKAKIELALVDWLKGKLITSQNGNTVFNLQEGKLIFNNNNTGVFRKEANASTMGLKFTNSTITVSGQSKKLSRIILGGDRRASDFSEGQWDQGGFTGVIIDTINGVTTADSEYADRVNIIGDTVRFAHTYSTDSSGTNSAPAGWMMENWGPTASISNSLVFRPFGTNMRNTNIRAGEYWIHNESESTSIRSVIAALKACFGHVLNGGISSDAINAIRSVLNGSTLKMF